MKKNLLIAILACSAGLLIFRSNAAGPSHFSHYDCTGAESAGTGIYANPIGCSASGVPCHGGAGASTSTILVTLELDSAGTATSHYKAGMSYMVKITGLNTSGTSLPNYGFQLAALADSVSTTSNADAGTWASTGLPAQTQLTPPSTSGTQLTVMEHNSPITVPSPGTIFTQTFAWTAPAAGTGTISFWGAANFVNGDALASALDKWNSGSLVIHEWAIPALVGNLTSGSGIQVYPNPVQDMLTLTNATGFTDGSSVILYDLTGHIVLHQSVAACGLVKLDVHDLRAGLYELRIMHGNEIQTMPVIKQ